MVVSTNLANVYDPYFALVLARQEQNSSQQLAMHNMELVRNANITQDQRAALEERIDMCLLLSDNYPQVTT